MSDILDLAELRRLAGEEKLPWVYDEQTGDVRFPDHHLVMDTDERRMFVAAACNAIPALLTRLEAAERECEGLVDEVAAIGTERQDLEQQLSEAREALMWELATVTEQRDDAWAENQDMAAQLAEARGLLREALRWEPQTTGNNTLGSRMRAVLGKEGSDEV